MMTNQPLCSWVGPRLKDTLQIYRGHRDHFSAILLERECPTRT